MDASALYHDLHDHAQAMLKQFRSAVAVGEEDLLAFITKVQTLGEQALGITPPAPSVPPAATAAAPVAPVDTLEPSIDAAVAAGEAHDQANAADTTNTGTVSS